MAAWIGSSEVGRPKAKAGADRGPVRATGRRAFAVAAAPNALVMRRRFRGCTVSSWLWKRHLTRARDGPAAIRVGGLTTRSASGVREHVFAVSADEIDLHL